MYYKYFAVLCLLSLQIVPGFSSDGCPEPQSIVPCRCYDYGVGYGLGMDCSDVTSDEQLNLVFQSTFPNNSFYELIMRGINNKPVPVEVLSKDTFGDCSFATISIEHTTLHTIQLETFYNSYDTLETYTISDSEVYFFGFEELVQFNKLEKLDLSNNGMPHFPTIKSATLKSLIFSGNIVEDLNEDKFIGAPSLGTLKFRNCSISAVTKDSFHGLSLEILDLSYNRFTDLVDQSIAVVEDSLIVLHLDFNNLVNIEHGFIRGLAANANVQFYNSGLKQLQQSVWEPVFNQLTHPDASVVISSNPLECGCDIVWLITNADHMGKLVSVSGQSPQCADGRYLTELKEEEICPQK